MKFREQSIGRYTLFWRLKFTLIEINALAFLVFSVLFFKKRFNNFNNSFLKSLLEQNTLEKNKGKKKNALHFYNETHFCSGC